MSARLACHHRRSLGDGDRALAAFLATLDAEIRDAEALTASVTQGLPVRHMRRQPCAAVVSAPAPRLIAFRHTA
jgi:hypothetical protein